MSPTGKIRKLCLVTGSAAIAGWRANVRCPEVVTASWSGYRSFELEGLLDNLQVERKKDPLFELIQGWSGGIIRCICAPLCIF